MIFDTDDLYVSHDNLHLLQRLKDANPLFRMTAFAVPAMCPDDYIEKLPDWIEVVPHGWFHGDPPKDGGECRDWDSDEMQELIDWINSRSPRWAKGFKAPGWVLSQCCYGPLLDAGWWLADQHYNDHRRPHNLPIHCEGDGDHVHTHVQNVCGNGLQESFTYLLQRVREAVSFELVSEVVRPWVPEAVAA